MSKVYKKNSNDKKSIWWHIRSFYLRRIQFKFKNRVYLSIAIRFFLTLIIVFTVFYAFFIMDFFSLKSFSIYYEAIMLSRFDNVIAFSLSSGWIVSWFFYFIVVYFPKKTKERRIKKNLIEYYLLFKTGVLSEFLEYINQPRSSDIIEKFLDTNECYKFFNKKPSDPYHDNEIMFYRIKSKITAYHFEIIQEQIAFFKMNFQMNLQMIEIKNRSILRYLTYVLSELNHLENLDFKKWENGDRKRFFGFFYQTYCGWDWFDLDGAVSYDKVEFCIKYA